MIWHTELPLLMPGAIGGLLLYEAQRAAGVRVALTGDGADELFGGYDVFRAARARRTLDASPLEPLRPSLFAAAARVGGQPRGLAAAVERDAATTARIAERHGGVVPPWYDAWQPPRRRARRALVARRARGAAGERAAGRLLRAGA